MTISDWGSDVCSSDLFGTGTAADRSRSMSGRYAAMFQRLRVREEGAFGAFVMLGDPDVATSAAILDALVEGGADMLEVGLPFSGPVAEGLTIQPAPDRALRQGVQPAAGFGPLDRRQEAR